MSVDKANNRVKASHRIFTATVLVATFLFFAGTVTAIWQNMFPSQADGSVSAALFTPAPQFPPKPPAVTQFTPDLPKRVHITFAMAGRVSHIYIAPKPKPRPRAVAAVAAPPSSPPVPSPGVLSYTQIEQLWVSAGGPAWAESAAASVAECESGGNTAAYNSSGASGLWQILGQVVSGYIFDPLVNARNAVSKFEASGDSWAQWVCTPRLSARSTGPKVWAVTLTAAHPHHGHRRIRAWRWAAHQHGKWYCWGGTGGCFDCSGLVMASWLHGAGVSLPRSTTEMLGSRKLVRVTGHPQRGDLAFFGTGHVELFDKWGWTYGASHTGTRIGFHHWSGSRGPTEFMRLG